MLKPDTSTTTARSTRSPRPAGADLLRQVPAVVLCLALGALGLAVSAGPAAAASEPGCSTNSGGVTGDTADCSFEGESGSDSPGSTSSAGSGGGSSSGKATCTLVDPPADLVARDDAKVDDSGDLVVDCSGRSANFAGVYTWWSQSRQCYVGVLPSSLAQDPAWREYWEGNYPDGALYLCEMYYLPAGVHMTGWPMDVFWSETIPAGPAAPEDPATVARRALAQLDLEAIEIGIVPEPGAGSAGVVGMPVWMWADDPTTRTMGTATNSVTTAVFTLTLTATVSRVEWDMGDGGTVTCTDAGTPYADSYGKKASPDCGYTYTKAGTYDVSATTHWAVEWSGMGMTGTIPLDLTSGTTITVAEAQVLTQ